MSQQLINLGAQPDDNTGDDARTGGRKINENFSELYGKVQNVQNLNLEAGLVTALPAGAAPTASVTGTYPNHRLNLGIPVGPTGPSGAGAPTSADILALARRSDLIADLRAIGITETPSLIADFIDDIYYADRSYIGASFAALGAALSSPSVGRATVANYFDKDGLMKSAAINVPRMDYDPVTRERRGLLCEGYATNIVPHSMLTGGTSTYDATLTAGASAFADGSTRMSRLTNTAAAGANNTSMCDMYIAVPNDTSTWTFSTFLRKGTAPRAALYLAFITGSAEIGNFFVIDWSTMTTTGPGKLRDLGGGLYRASITVANNGSGNVTAAARVYTRDNGGEHVIGEYVDIGGWQFEQGGEATSFIESNGSTVTRLIDRAALGLGSWAGPSVNTILVEFEADPLNKSRVPLFLSEATGNFGAGVYLVRGGSDITAAPATAPADLGISVNDAVTRKIRAVARFKTNDSALSCNGSAAATDGGCTIPDLDALVLGSAYFGHGFSASLDGHLRRVIAFPTALSDAKLQLLSALNWRTP